MTCIKNCPPGDASCTCANPDLLFRKRNKRTIRIDDVFDHLTVTGLSSERRSGRTRRLATVRCSCGVVKVVSVDALWSGDAKSCGCHQEDRDDPEALFRSKIEVTPNGCHIWQGAIDKDGYGKFQITTATRKQKHVRAHRYAFFLKHGRWPKRNGLHSCDTPACVNADHVTDGTQRENIQQCIARGRHRYQKRAA